LRPHVMIAVHDLTKVFELPNGRELRAVDGVSFRVAAGEVYGLLGPNGAGKTTTLRMLLGLLTPTAGYAAIADFRSREHPDEVKRRVGLVAAGTGLYQHLTVREVLLFFADLYDVAPSAAQAQLTRLTGLLGLAPLLDRHCAGLSTGQKQRVNLARALIHSPPIMLLDEPTLGLDVLGTQVIIEFIELLKAEGKSVILCTHHLEEAERLCDRFGLLHQGRLVAEGTLAELRTRSGCQSLREIFLRWSTSGPLLAQADLGSHPG
jgi:sodium transport system ATP-binding protein